MSKTEPDVDSLTRWECLVNFKRHGVAVWSAMERSLSFYQLSATALDAATLVFPTPFLACLHLRSK